MKNNNTKFTDQELIERMKNFIKFNSDRVNKIIKTNKTYKEEFSKYMRAITKGRKRPKGKLNMREYNTFMRVVHKKEIDKPIRVDKENGKKKLFMKAVIINLKEGKNLLYKK